MHGMNIKRKIYIDVSKDVRIRGYFPKPKGFREQRSLGNCCDGDVLCIVFV
jgi:hypothetical protein